MNWLSAHCQPLQNTDIPRDTWLRMFTRDQLRALAQKNGITRGRSKKDVAFYLSQGYPYPFRSDSFGIAGVPRVRFKVGAFALKA